MSTNPLYGDYAFSLIMASEAFQKKAGKLPENSGEAAPAESNPEAQAKNISKGPEVPGRR